jgi:predicted  nucleic acid-binding Zn-ribbon protein
MPSTTVTRLLRLQDAELHLLAITKDLKRFPLERSREEEVITAENQRAAEAREQLQALERRRSELVREQAVEEDKLIRLKSQQAQVKKNEEYQALSAEIERSEAQVIRLEEEQLEVLFEIDREKEKCIEVSRSTEAAIETHRKKIAAIGERLTQTESERTEAEVRLSAERDSQPVEFIKLYDEARKRVAPPWIVPLKDHSCTGCHLRVSNEVYDRAGDELPAVCDQCGRLVYID